MGIKKLGCSDFFVGNEMCSRKFSKNLVVPAKAGIHREFARVTSLWIPAFAGTTEGYARALPTKYSDEPKIECIVLDFNALSQTLMAKNNRSAELKVLKISVTIRKELYFLGENFIIQEGTLVVLNKSIALVDARYSTVTDFARFLGLSTSVPRASAV